MKISIGFDHGALPLRQALLEHLQSGGHEIIDHGTDSPASVDYPDFSREVCKDVTEQRAEIGILCCTTGIGMSMSANKFKGIRAALVQHEDEAALTRRHNNANVICFGALHTTPYEACRLVDCFIENAFEGGRHERRVAKFMELEEESCS
ncbi:ribose 5-phosphate isomerase B [Puniceicoccales bacterium CK1056]|uniref:Ribose 5-phosphate isomerase B n=1 Tax=Oceanipulchritudo coccoides TaxID=2706888 RepID=A0A6B2M1E9_9BACT|nr:ribose 5-phosphate isomerase B [Oceanipulchritudo coccoides]NDV62543.1 ribose 5-phosphate isomerase B [Oceanipulchritudo coccoides]